SEITSNLAVCLSSGETDERISWISGPSEYGTMSVAYVREYCCQPTASTALQDIGQRVLVQYFDECTQRLTQDRLEFAGVVNLTGIGLRIEASQKLEVRLHVLTALAQSNPWGFAGQRNAAGSSRRHFDIALFAERLNNADEVVLRDPVDFTDSFRCGNV